MGRRLDLRQRDASDAHWAVCLQVAVNREEMGTLTSIVRVNPLAAVCRGHVHCRYVNHDTHQVPHGHGEKRPIAIAAAFENEIAIVVTSPGNDAVERWRIVV